MSIAEMQATIEKITTPGKGILAADESIGTITKRFESIGIESTEESRRDYRELLFTTPNLHNFISGVILFEETLSQKSQTGKLLVTLLEEQGIVPGIKVDKGLIPLSCAPSEKVTSGLDGLADRLATYKAQGARFAKWRAVYFISDVLPSRQAISANVEGLARYASECQKLGIVPIVEPEVLMDGMHSLSRSASVHEEVLHEVFAALYRYKVSLEQIILKPSMVITGSENPEKASVDAVAKATVQVLRRAVPASVPTINFLSGGQGDEEATAHLNAMNILKISCPWVLSFSYGRALQSPALHAWKGDNANKKNAQEALFLRAKYNSEATLGSYTNSIKKYHKLT